MGLINYSSIEDGTTIDAADVNTPLTTIYNDYNGNIDSNNLADNAVTTAKIGDGAVTNAKLSTTAGEPGGAWKGWTPTWTNLTIGNATVTAKYTQIGKTVIGYIQIIVGSTTSFSAPVRISVPVTVNASYNAYATIGNIVCIDGTLTAATGITRFDSATGTLYPLVNKADSTYSTLTSLASTVPMTWATGDILYLTFEYEAA